MSTDADLLGQLSVLMKDISRHCPITGKAMLARKFALPQYRAPDYFDQDMINRLSLMMLMLPTMPGFVTDDVVQSQLLNIFQSLECNRPTLFLERELGEILTKTAIPGFLETSDIHFPFPSIRIMLPKKLLGIPSQNRWLMFLDIGHLEADGEARCPFDIARELDAYGGRRHMLTRMTFTYPSDAVAIAGQLDHGVASSYAVTKPLKGTLEQFSKIGGKLRTDYPNDAFDEILLDGMERLALNILLILSAMPLEYEPLTVERKERQEGKRTIPALLRAKWVGDVLLRAKRAGHVKGDLPVAGRKLPAHWTSGHWKMQPHGKGHALRRLIYILPYHTHGNE